MHTPMILIICQFCICNFTYWLKSIWNPKINTWGFFTIIAGHGHTEQWKLRVAHMCTSPADVQQGAALPCPFGNSAETTTGWRQQGAAQCSTRHWLYGQLRRVWTSALVLLLGWSLDTSKPIFVFCKTKQI